MEETPEKPGIPGCTDCAQKNRVFTRSTHPLFLQLATASSPVLQNQDFALIGKTAFGIAIATLSSFNWKKRLKGHHRLHSEGGLSFSSQRTLISGIPKPCTEDPLVVLGILFDIVPVLLENLTYWLVSDLCAHVRRLVFKASEHKLQNHSGTDLHRSLRSPQDITRPAWPPREHTSEACIKLAEATFVNSDRFDSSTSKSAGTCKEKQ